MQAREAELAAERSRHVSAVRSPLRNSANLCSPLTLVCAIHIRAHPLSLSPSPCTQTPVELSAASATASPVLAVARRSTLATHSISAPAAPAQGKVCPPGEDKENADSDALPLASGRIPSDRAPSRRGKTAGRIRAKSVGGRLGGGEWWQVLPCQHHYTLQAGPGQTRRKLQAKNNIAEATHGEAAEKVCPAKRYGLLDRGHALTNFGNPSHPKQKATVRSKSAGTSRRGTIQSQARRGSVGGVGEGGGLRGFVDRWR